MAGKPSPAPNYHLARINQPPRRAIRSPGVFGDRGFIFSAPEMRLGKGACHKNHQPEWVFQAPCNLLVNVPLVQQEDGQAPAPW